VIEFLGSTEPTDDIRTRKEAGIVAKVYEVWDTLTANRIGAFSTEAEARALLLDVLRVNGPTVVADMAVLSSDTDASGEDLEMVIDGADLAATHQLPV
jgi:hypothetical protein